MKSNVCFCTRAAVLGACLSLVLASAAFAQPVNDDCADAIVIGDGLTPFSTVGATTDGPDHPDFCSFGGTTPNDIWYQYTATCTDDLVISTCDIVDYDSDIVVYEGCDCNNLQFLGCNDDGPGCAGFSSHLVVPVVAGQCYLIRVGKWTTSTGDGGGDLLVQCGDIGACCMSGGACNSMLEPDCTAAGGSFQGSGTGCVDNPCSGACCASDGTCTETSATGCAASGGTYTGGADCQSVSCSGACCLPDDTCQTLTPAGCAQVGGLYNGNGTPCTPTLCLVIGPDVVYTRVNGISGFGPVNGVRAYSLGSDTCNIGDENLLWTNDGTPGLSMNMYRLYDGRLEQIGMGWLKTACCAAAGSGCGLACNGNGGNVLGAGCLDVYGSGWNSIQGNLTRRSNVNGFTGAFTGAVGAGGSDIAGRLQVRESDMSSANYPGALYFVEGHYLATDDASSHNSMNNASYHRVTVSGSFGLSLTGSTQTEIPAIFAWRDHGAGAGVTDPSVEIVDVDIPLEGRFIVAGKAEDLGGGQYRYSYSVFNINSDVAGGSFSVPIPAGANVTDVGFHDVDYHSGDPYDNTDWSSTIGANSVSWSSPQTFAQNANTNALRYSTMYTFWFTADVAPANGQVTIGLFKPWSPSSVSASIVAPDTGAPACGGDLGDVNTDASIDGADVSSFVECLLTGSTSNGNCACADMNNAGAVELGDVSMFVNALLN